MNSTAAAARTQHSLTFDSHEIKTIKRDGQIWMSGTEIGRALEYADPDTAIKKLFNRSAEEFTSTMTRIVKVMTAGGKQAVRFFSLRGAHLLAMFARTDKAKAFRIWVLDILDCEVARHSVRPAPSKELSQLTQDSISGLCRRTDAMCAWWRKFGSAIQALSPQKYWAAHENFMFAQAEAHTIQKDLGIVSIRKYMDGYPWLGTFTDRDLYRRKFAEQRGAV